MSSTAPSAGFMGSWVEVVMAGRWLRNFCRSTAKVALKMALSWFGRARPLLETTPYPSGQYGSVEGGKKTEGVYMK